MFFMLVSLIEVSVERRLYLEETVQTFIEVAH